jgi:hypothetical protein
MTRVFVLLVLLLGLLAPSAQAAQPATFDVGAATKSIDPPPGVQIYAGGFGRSPGLGPDKVHDPLQVKAFYVERGGKAVAFAVVDCQAWFTAYQNADDGSPQPYGIYNARTDVAKLVRTLSPDSIIVQGTHSHAAATLEGIWGPVPKRYLKLVHDQTVAAIAEAARTARPAHLQWATVDAPYLDNIVTAQTDSYTGWSQDGQVSVLRAVAPGNGATIGTFVNVPAHPDIVIGSDGVLSADYFGVTRAGLEDKLGGTSVVGGATLGREETPTQTDGLQAAAFIGREVEELATRAIGRAHWITDAKVAAVTTRVQVTGANPLLLSLVAANHLPPAQKQQFFDTGDIYPINRADTPPWLTGSVLATDLTAIRIGPLAYVSMPGESFPEVRNAIAKATDGAKAVVALAKGQDDLGYFYPAWVHPFTFMYDSDHWTYNVAPQLGDQVILSQLGNLGRLGFRTRPNVATPMKTDFTGAVKAGIQAMASPARGSLGRDGTFTTTFEAWFESPPYGSKPTRAEKVHWDFGDGTKADSEAGKNTRFPHPYTAPGRYEVKLHTKDTDGNTVSWELPVRVYRELRATIAVRGGHVVANAAGGAKPMLAYRWRFDDGSTGSGQRVKPPRGATEATLRVTDATGTVAQATRPLP